MNRSTAFPYVAVDPRTQHYLQAIGIVPMFTPDIRMAARHTRDGMERLARQFGLHGVGYKPRGVRR